MCLARQTEELLQLLHTYHNVKTIFLHAKVVIFLGVLYRQHVATMKCVQTFWSIFYHKLAGGVRRRVS